MRKSGIGLAGRVILAGASVLPLGGCMPVAGGVAGYYYGKDVAKQKAANMERNKSNFIIPRPPKPIMRMRRWKDNGDYYIDDDELFGEIGDSVNLGNTSLCADIIFYSNRPEPITYTLIDSSDNIIKTGQYFTDPFCLFEGSALAPGEYTLNAKQKGGIRNVDVSRVFTVLR